MKGWIGLFLLMLALGVGWGLARDILSKERRTLEGVVTAIEPRDAFPKWLPGAPPRFKVRLTDDKVVDVATTDATSAAVGGKITVTERVTPWGQVWYTQRQ